MKNVYAKATAKGSTVFYRDGKRISRASLTAAYVDEARASLAALGFDTAASNDNSFVVEIRLVIPVACDRWVGDRADINVVFTINVDTVTAGVEVMKSAKRNLYGFTWATVYDAREYAEAYYDLWHMERYALRLNNAGTAWFINGGGRVYAEYAKETANTSTTVYCAQENLQRADDAVDNYCKEVDYAKKLLDESCLRRDEARDELFIAVANHLKAVTA